jgi:hypothetical protein
MRYTYKVKELTPIPQEDHFEVGESKEMQAMSLKKLQRKLDAKKEYHIEYRNKKDNFVSTTIRGRDNG